MPNLLRINEPPENSVERLLYINDFEWKDAQFKQDAKGDPKKGRIYPSLLDLDTDTYLLMLNQSRFPMSFDGSRLIGDFDTWKCNISVITSDNLPGMILDKMILKTDKKLIDTFCKVDDAKEMFEKPPASPQEAATGIGDVAILTNMLEKLKGENEPLFLALASAIRFTNAKWFGNGGENILETEIILGSRLGPYAAGTLLTKYVDDYLNLIKTQILPSSPIVLSIVYTSLLELARNAVDNLENQNN